MVQILWRRPVQRNVDDSQRFVEYHNLTLVAEKECEACGNLFWTFLSGSSDLVLDRLPTGRIW